MSEKLVEARRQANQARRHMDGGSTLAILDYVISAIHNIIRHLEKHYD